jgi:hypothetical protein
MPMTLLLSLLLACATQTCEVVTIPGCAMLEACVTCTGDDCAESVELLRTGRSWECDTRDRNRNGVADCWDRALGAACR